MNFLTNFNGEWMEALITPVDSQLMAGDLIEYEGKNMIAIQVLIDYMDDNLTKV